MATIIFEPPRSNNTSQGCCINSITITPPVELRLGCTVNVRPGAITDEITTHFRGLPHALSPIHFSNNNHNLLNSILARVTCNLPLCDKREMRAFTDFVKKNLGFFFSKMKNVKPVTFEKYLENSNCTPTNKIRYKKAYAKMCEENIDVNTHLSSDQILKFSTTIAFMKVENLLYHNSITSLEKTGRVISSCSPEFTILVGQFFQPFSDMLKKVWNRNFFITFSSGLNVHQLGRWLDDKPNNFHLVEDDVSKFDVCIRKQLLQLEVVIAKFVGAPHAVIQLMEGIIKTNSKTYKGITFKTPDGRKSGVPYTSAFNSILNALMHIYIYLKETGGSLSSLHKEFSILVCGDDNVIVSSKKVDFKSGMGTLGFKATTKHIMFKHLVSFCSSHFIRTATGLVLLPNLGRVIAKFAHYVNYNIFSLDYLLASSAKGLINSCSYYEPFNNLLQMHIDKVPDASPVADVYKHYCANKIIPNGYTLLDMESHTGPLPRDSSLYGFRRLFFDDI